MFRLVVPAIVCPMHVFVDGPDTSHTSSASRRILDASELEMLGLKNHPVKFTYTHSRWLFRPFDPDDHVKPNTIGYYAEVGVVRNPLPGLVALFEPVDVVNTENDGAAFLIPGWSIPTGTAVTLAAGQPIPILACDYLIPVRHLQGFPGPMGLIRKHVFDHVPGILACLCRWHRSSTQPLRYHIPYPSTFELEIIEVSRAVIAPRTGEDHAEEDHAGEDRTDEDYAGEDHADEDHAGEDHADEDHAATSLEKVAAEGCSEGSSEYEHSIAAIVEGLA